MTRYLLSENGEKKHFRFQKDLAKYLGLTPKGLRDRLWQGDPDIEKIPTRPRKALLQKGGLAIEEETERRLVPIEDQNEFKETEKGAINTWCDQDLEWKEEVSTDVYGVLREIEELKKSKETFKGEIATLMTVVEALSMGPNEDVSESDKDEKSDNEVKERVDRSKPTVVELDENWGYGSDGYERVVEGKWVFKRKNGKYYDPLCRYCGGRNCGCDR